MIIHDKQTNQYYEDEIELIESLKKNLKNKLQTGNFFVCKIVNGRLVDDRPLNNEDIEIIIEVAAE